MNILNKIEKMPNALISKKDFLDLKNEVDKITNLTLISYRIETSYGGVKEEFRLHKKGDCCFKCVYVDLDAEELFSQGKETCKKIYNELVDLREDVRLKLTDLFKQGRIQKNISPKESPEIKWVVDFENILKLNDKQAKIDFVSEKMLNSIYKKDDTVGMWVYDLDNLTHNIFGELKKINQIKRR